MTWDRDPLRGSPASARKTRALSADVSERIDAVTAEVALVRNATVRAAIRNNANAAIDRFYDGVATLAELITALNTAHSRARAAQAEAGPAPASTAGIVGNSAGAEECGPDALAASPDSADLSAEEIDHG